MYIVLFLSEGMDFEILNKSFLDIIWGDIEKNKTIEDSEWRKRIYNYYDSSNKVAYDLSIWFSIYYSWIYFNEKEFKESLKMLNSYMSFDSKYIKDKYSIFKKIIRVLPFENKELTQELRKNKINFLIIKK